MSDTQFTRLDWRPSNKRATYPRVRAWGGQKQAPPAFLAAAKLSGFGKGPQRRCIHCTQWAMRESFVCRIHLGGRVAARFRPYRKSPYRYSNVDPVSAP